MVRRIKLKKRREFENKEMRVDFSNLRRFLICALHLSLTPEP